MVRTEYRIPGPALAVTMVNCSAWLEVVVLWSDPRFCFLHLIVLDTHTPHYSPR